jgi:hypothetical protein
MALFDTLGFQWNRDSVPREIPRASLERVVFRFHRMLPEYVWDAGVLEENPFTFPYVWDAGVLEENPFTFPEVKTLLEGVTVVAASCRIRNKFSISQRAQSSLWIS